MKKQFKEFLDIEKSFFELNIDTWKDQQALDMHHNSKIMSSIEKLREKYDLHMVVERYVQADINDSDVIFMRK